MSEPRATVGPAGPRWRSDIQALRGWAVIAVILFHADLGIAPSGYLGVDMFFVISGFLISGIVMRARAAGRFRLGDFYLRRVRRLLPASAVVLFATTAVAAGLLSASGYARFWPQLIGALTFSTNVALYRQINYFNDSAVFEPLLHLWSLAIEEQYYLLLPFALACMPRRYWLAAFTLATLASFVAYVTLYPRSPGAVFYLLPTRAWEIGLGSIGALLVERQRARVLATRLRWSAVAAIAAIVCLTPPAHLAFLLAVPAGVATLAMLLAEPIQLKRTFAPLIVAGDMSYSLYLVHWPLFAFCHVLYLGASVPAGVSLALVAASFALGALLYRYVEEPVRRAPIGARKLCLIALAGSIAIAALAYGGLRMRQALAPDFDLHGITGLDLPGCDADAVRFDGRCAQPGLPQMLIWGDSFSQHIIPAITVSTTRPIAQASKGGCPPLIGLAPVDLQGAERWARGCIAFNDSVVRYLAERREVKVVALSGRYLRYTQPGTRLLARDAKGRLSLGPPGVAQLVAAQARTTAMLRALGKRVILVGAPPQAGFDVGLCWERTLGHLPAIAAAPACAITPRTAHPEWQWTIEVMTLFATRAATPVLRIDRALCMGATCATAWNHVPLYRDAAHLGQTGSVLLGRRLALGERIWRDAR